MSRSKNIAVTSDVKNIQDVYQDGASILRTIKNLRCNFFSWKSEIISQ